MITEKEFALVSGGYYDEDEDDDDDFDSVASSFTTYTYDDGSSILVDASGDVRSVTSATGTQSYVFNNDCVQMVISGLTAIAAARAGQALLGFLAGASALSSGAICFKNP